MRHATTYGFYEILPMPAQPQLAICHGFGVPEDDRGRGFAHRLKQHQIRHLQDQQYDAAICTVRMDNARQIAVLKKAGYAHVSTFRDRRQACDVGIFVLTLHPARDYVGTGLSNAPPAQFFPLLKEASR